MNLHSPAKKIELLKMVDVFSAIQSHQLEVVGEYSEFLELKEGEKLFSEGDPGNALFIVESGEVVVQKREEYPEGPEIHIARFISGNGFGELDLFSDAPRTAEALANSDTLLLRFPRRDTQFQSFLEAHPEISAQVLHRILVVITARIRRANELVKENSPLVQELKKLVYRDKLTGIYNQSYLTETLRDYIHKQKRPFALLISKPDNFKDLNDTYGHEAGDRAIRIMAKGLREFIGDDNRTARYKGNAMAVILPEADREGAQQKAEEIRRFLNELDLSELTGTNPFTLTASVGIGFYPEHGKDVEELIRMTHELPLIGRQQGGNRILFPEEGEAVL